MVEEKQDSKKNPFFDSVELSAILKSLFKFGGTLTRAEFYSRAIFVAIGSFASLLLSWIPVLGPFLVLVAIAIFASVSVQRLRSMNYPWWLVFLAVIPVIGWAALAFLMTVKAKSTQEDESLKAAHLWVIATTSFATATFLTIAIAANAGSSNDVPRSTSSDQGSQQEIVENSPSGDIENIEAQAEAAAAEEAELAEKARIEEEEKAAAEEEARVAAETDVEFLKLINGLQVASEVKTGYDRDLFKHWIDADGNGCDTRREVLIDESRTPVTVGAGCDLTGGTWVSAFDGVETTNPSDFDVDHFVPLSEAWASGANTWNADTRERFANDLNYDLSLIAVSASSNRSKSDSDVAEWLPSNSDYVCEYVFAWVNVKYRWSLSIDELEKKSILESWTGCSISELDFTSKATRTRVVEEATEPVQEAAPTPAPTPAPETPALPGGCVDVNHASIDELQQIIHIGPDRAQQIINLRPFSSYNDLGRISGIAVGGVRLNEIISQGLACFG